MPIQTDIMTFADTDDATTEEQAPGADRSVGKHVPEINSEIPPPWIIFTDWPYGSFSEVSGVREISQFWRPFWDALSEPGRQDYLNRYPPPGDWRTFIDHVRFDQKVAEIDAADIASGGLQPGGSPWKSPERAPPTSFLGRVIRRLGG